MSVSHWAWLGSVTSFGPWGAGENGAGCGRADADARPRRAGAPGRPLPGAADGAQAAAAQPSLTLCKAGTLT